MRLLRKAYIWVYAGDLDHCAACLAQGLATLGVKVASNVPFRVDSRGISTPGSVCGVPPGFEVHPPDGEEDLLILQAPEALGYPWDDVMRLSAGKHVVMVNMRDDANHWDYPPAIRAFVSHVNRFARRIGRIYPLAFGLSDDLIERSRVMSAQGAFSEKDGGFVLNFNKTPRQDVRNALELALVESLARAFPVDRRHLGREAYAEQLRNAGAVLAYGGCFHANYLDFDYLREAWKGKAEAILYNYQSFEREVVVFRWDSWRFWEACAFGCAPVQLDFEKYGFDLPVMPKAWEHYIPVDFGTVNTLPQILADKVAADPDLFRRIGRAARAWALEHYSPVPSALRVIEALG